MILLRHSNTINTNNNNSNTLKTILMRKDFKEE